MERRSIRIGNRNQATSESGIVPETDSDSNDGSEHESEYEWEPEPLNDEDPLLDVNEDTETGETAGSQETDVNPQNQENQGTEAGTLVTEVTRNPTNLMDQAQLGQLLTALQASAAANTQLAQATQQRAAAQGAAARAFNLRPYGSVLDTSTKHGAELYSQAIKPFETKYNGAQDGLATFTAKIKQRAGHLQCLPIFCCTQD